MSIGDNAQKRVAVVKETTHGVTPTTPAFKIARTRTAELVIDKPYRRSDERQNHRMVAAMYKALASYGANLSMIWADDDGFDDVLESFFGLAWATGVLKNGAGRLGLTVEELHELGSTDLFRRVAGWIPDTLDFEMRPGEPIQANFSGPALSGTGDATTAIASSTYAAAGVEPESSGCDITALSAFGLSSQTFLRLKSTLRNNHRAQPQLMTPDPAGIGIGQFVGEFELDMYLKDAAPITAALAGTESTVSVTFGPTANKRYTMLLPKAKLIGHRVPDGGNNTDGIVTVLFEALRDPTEATAVKLTRDVA